VQSRRRISPVLVGRDELLALVERRAAEARGGAGQLLFLAGEAGIGKTRLLGATLRAASRIGLHQASAAAFPRDSELSGALLIDLADQLMRSERAPWVERGGLLLDRIRDGHVGTRGDPHRHRRLLVLDVADILAGLAGTGPAVIGLEDLHWADDLTLEVIGQLARRLGDLPMLVVGTYRSDELYPRVPMREWRSRLLRQRQAEEVRLPRLDLVQTATLVTLILGGELPAPQRLVERLHRRSDGIPLHVEELLGALEERGADDPFAMSLPDTLSDAILERAGQLTPTARRVAGSAAVIGRSFDIDLICAVDGRAPERVGRALAELERRFFVVGASDGWFDFRHALIRDALAAALDPARRRQLHRRVAEAASSRPEIGSHSFLSAHYELAGVQDRAHHHALVAAARAAALSAHRESLELCRRALRTAPPEPAPGARAALLRSLAAEEAANDLNYDAAQHLDEARRLLRAANDPIAAAELLPPLVAARHLLGEDLEGRAARIQDELAALRRHPAGAGTRGRLLAALSAAEMLDRRLDESIEHGTQALALAKRDGDTATQLHVAATVGSCLVFAGRMDEGWQMLEGAVREARRSRREAEAARAHRMIGTSASVLVEYEIADRWLREGIEYAERTEQWNHRHYMTAHLAHVAWATGDWDAAEALADHALADGRGGITTTITALYVRGYVALGRGEDGRAAEALGEARRLGEEMRELQRLAPPLWGQAEAALLSRRHAEAVALTELGLEASSRVRDAAYLFPFLVTGTRARLAQRDTVDAERWVNRVGAAITDRSIPGTLPAVDHARGLLHLAAGHTGKAREALANARDGWLKRSRWWEAAWSGIDLAQCLYRSNRAAEAAAVLDELMADAQRLRAAPVIAAAREIGSRLAARHRVVDDWSPLTAREFAVARLVAEGRTNREIAEALSITPKTVSAHVEHILDRLGAARRAEIAAWVADRHAEGGVRA
jgi:DNA-binding CsgD family transcriptional regulator